MDDSERKRLLDAARRQSGTVGVDLPETVTVDGEPVEVASVVFECRRVGELSAEQRERVEELVRRLRRERLERIHQLEDAALDYEEGEAIVEEVRRIDRALSALTGLMEPDFAEKTRQERLRRAEGVASLLRQRP